MNRSVDYHFLTAVAVFCIYGIHVCPFLESLSVLELMLPVVFVMLVVYLIVKRLGPGMSFSQGDECVQLAQYWQWVFCAFVAASMALVIYNSLSYDYPIDSALKVLLGLSTLGFFIATDLTLIFEREQAQRLGAMGVHLTPPTQFMPMTRKFTLFAGINALGMAGVIFLVVQKDLLWLLGDGQSVTLEQARWVILFEVAFVAVVVLGYTIKVIRSYSSNLAFFFNNENHALRKVAQGDLTVRTPVASQDEFGVMAHHTNLMIQDLQQATEEVKQTRDVAILGLSSLAEARDNETGAHILRTQYYVKALAEYLSSQPGFAEYLDQQTIELMHKSAPLHDVGKVGIPDAILLKPGKLTDDEFAIMKQHPEIGAQAIANAESELGSNSFLRFAREISETHHEKWDGTGYPKGLKGKDIPLSGRLMALADVYDALISKRVYKPAFPHEKAKQILLEGKGSHFDPDVVDAFLACEAQFMDIARTYKDQSASD